MLDEADAFSSLAARGIPGAVVGGIAGGRNPAGIPSAFARAQPRHVEQVLVTPLRQPRRARPRRHQDFLQLGRLDQPVAVEIDGAGVMLPASGIKPVTTDEVAIGVEAAEECVREHRLPDIVLDLHPVGDDLRALDLDLLAGRGLIDDALLVGCTSPRRVDAFPIDAGMNGDDIARLRHLDRGRNRPERLCRGPFVLVVSVNGHMELFGRGEQRCHCQQESGNLFHR